MSSPPPCKVCKLCPCPIVKNLTLEPRIDAHVTNAILSRLQEDGTYKVTKKGRRMPSSK